MPTLSGTLPSALREIAMTLLKALIAVGVFGAIIFGWGYSKAREQQALNLLRSRKYDQELQTWLRQIRDEAYVEIKQ